MTEKGGVRMADIYARLLLFPSPSMHTLLCSPLLCALWPHRFILNP